MAADARLVVGVAARPSGRHRRHCVPRTLFEEQTLRAELPGYTEYTQRVKYRWVPGVW